MDLDGLNMTIPTFENKVWKIIKDDLGWNDYQAGTFFLEYIYQNNLEQKFLDYLTTVRAEELDLACEYCTCGACDE